MNTRPAHAMVCRRVCPTSVGAAGAWTDIESVSMGACATADGGTVPKGACGYGCDLKLHPPMVPHD